jgi:hypothetical protein
VLFSTSAFCQPKKVELFDLVKKLVQDSTGYETTGDWAVGHPSAYPVQWQADRIEMSDDEKINFFRKGTANITVNGATYLNMNKPVKWDVMLKGPRMGFSSFSIQSASHKSIAVKMTIDSIFGKKPYNFRLLKACSGEASGFYYYEVKMPKKVMAWIKISWACSAGNCRLSLDGYDDWSKQYADLDCAQ